MVDLEHSPLSFDFAYQAIVVAQGLGMAAIVRVPDRSGSHTQRLLDAGADGLLVPQVSTAEGSEASRPSRLRLQMKRGSMPPGRRSTDS